LIGPSRVPAGYTGQIIIRSKQIDLKAPDFAWTKRLRRRLLMSENILFFAVIINSFHPEFNA
jgi:hypothetical protein